jgi:hypothetical protein
LAADDNALTNLERLLTAEIPGRNDLLAAAKLIAIAQDRHLTTLTAPPAGVIRSAGGHIHYEAHIATTRRA